MPQLGYPVVTGMLMCSVLLSGAAQEMQPPAAQFAIPAQYSATAFGQAGSAAGRNFTMNVYVRELSSNAEIDELAGTLKSKGPEGLMKAMNNMKEKGRVTPTGSVGTAMAVVRIQPTKNGGQHILLMTNRPIALAEMTNSTRSRNYPFSIVVLNIDKDGKGSGFFAPACTIRFDKKDDVEIEHYGQKPFRMANVFRQK
jgi:hypothetical protein